MIKRLSLLEQELMIVGYKEMWQPQVMEEFYEWDVTLLDGLESEDS